MSAPADPITAEVLATLPAAVDPLALAHNENPFPPLPWVRSALIRAIDVANRYPDFMPDRLGALIAGRVGVRAEQVVLGAGATGVVQELLQALTAPGDRIVLTSPTFDGYPILARMARLTTLTVPLDAHGRHDLAALADAGRDARVVVLCRPHNPTGTLEPASAVEEFLRRVPRDTVVLLDEAYIEFVAPGHRLDTPALVRRFPNVVALRTFSKAYGLAGLRIGYGFAAPDVAQDLRAMQAPFGVGITSAVAVAASYDAESQLRQRVAVITREGRYLQRRLRAMGVYTTDSHANLVYLPRVKGSWRDVFEPAGVRCRYYEDGAARITVGTRSSTRAVLAAAAKYA